VTWIEPQNPASQYGEVGFFFSSVRTERREEMKKTLFMIHGMFCGAWCWEKYKAFFEDKGYECVTTTLHHQAESLP